MKSESGLTFDGAESIAPKKALSKYSGNQHGGAAEGNFGRGATKGNTGSTSNAGPKKPAVSPVKDTASACNSLKAGTFNAGGQVRGQGGARVDTGRTTFNSGRGPTKGNQQ